MPPQIVLMIPLGGLIGNIRDHLGGGVDPGYGLEAPVHPDQGGPSPGRPSTGPVWPGFPGRPGHSLPRPGRPVDPGYGIPDTHPDQGLPPGIDNSLPPPGPEVQPPIFLPVDPTQPPTVWPPAGAVQPPIAMPPPGIWPLPKPASGYIVVYLPGYGVTYVKLGVSVGGGPAPTPAPKA